MPNNPGAAAGQWRRGAMSLLLLFAGCSQLPPTSSVIIPPVRAGESRIWLYRNEGPYESHQTPYFRLNGQPVGISEPDAALYRDVPPGHYTVSVDSYGVPYPNQFANFEMRAGQEIFIKVVSMRERVGAAAAMAALACAPFSTLGLSPPTPPGPKSPVFLFTAAADRMMKKLLTKQGPCIATALLLAAAGCAQLPPTSSVAIPPIPAGTARVWFYRDFEPHETLARPYIWLNGQIAGISEPGGAFYRDVAPAHYSIRVDSAGRDFNQVAEAELAPGQEAYAKIVSLRSWLDDDCIIWGGCDTLYVWLIRPEEARPAIGKSPFYGGN